METSVEICVEKSVEICIEINVEKYIFLKFHFICIFSHFALLCPYARVANMWN